MTELEKQINVISILDCEHDWESTPLVQKGTFRRMFRCAKCPAGEWR